MRRCGSLSLSLVASIPFYERDLPPPFFAAPLLFSLSRHQEPLSTLTNYGRTPRLTFQEWIFIKRLRHTHLPPMEFTNYFFIKWLFPLSDDGGLLLRTRSFPSRHEQDEHAPVGRWRIDVHACRNEASVSRT